MPSSTPKPWEAPCWDPTPSHPFRCNPTWTQFTESDCQLGLLEAEQGCQGGFPAWSSLIMCQDVWVPRPPPQGHSHQRNSSSCSKAGLLEETRERGPSAQLYKICFRWAAKHKAATKRPSPNNPLSHSHPLVSSLMLTFQKHQTQNLLSVAWLQGSSPCPLSRATLDPTGV